MAQDERKQKKSNIPWTVLGLMLGLLLASLDQTIVSTAMPTIIGKLGGLDYYVWVFSAYLIANVISMPIFGKLGDMYGRKLFFLLGLTVFMIGSALCGTSSTMTELILYRAIQGIGGGALMPITFAIVFSAGEAGQNAGAVRCGIRHFQCAGSAGWRLFYR